MILISMSYNFLYCAQIKNLFTFIVTEHFHCVTIGEGIDRLITLQGHDLFQTQTSHTSYLLLC